MRIVYDHQVFSFQKYGGISRYFTELLNQFRKDPDLKPELCLKFSDNRYLEELQWNGVKPLLGDLKFKGKMRLVEYFNRRYCQAFFKRSDFDLAHPTYYHPYFMECLKGRPFVITIYDMIHELFPEMFAPNRIREYKRRVASKASQIIAISHNTKADILRFFDVDESKIHVIHPASRLSEPDVTAESRLGLPATFLLFTGDRAGYKNFPKFLEAVALVFREDPDLKLVCVGGGAFTQMERKRLTALGLDGRTFRYSVSDSELSYIYSRARIFIFPSLYEGFGFPILEAFSQGCPIALSETSSFPEVAGNAAVYFDPHSAQQMAETISGLLNNDHLRRSLISEGKSRLRSFNWGTVAFKTKEVYHKAV